MSAPKTILFHVGLPKTGTTSIQAQLSHAALLLEEAGVLVPGPFPQDADVARSSDAVFHRSILGYAYSRLSNTPEEDRLWQESLARWRGDPGSRLCIVSQENQLLCGGLIRAEVWSDLARHASIEVLAYLREPTAWITSLYAQTIAGAGPFCHPIERHPALTRYLTQGYAGMLDDFAPYGRIIVRAFEQVRAGNRLLADFGAIIGVPAFAEGGAEIERKNTKRFERDQILFLAAAKQEGLDHAVLHPIQMAFLHAGDGPRRLATFLSQDLIDAIRARWEEDRAIIAERHGVAIEAGEPVPPADPGEALSADRLREQVRDRLTRRQQALFERVLERLVAAGQAAGAESSPAAT